MKSTSRSKSVWKRNRDRGRFEKPNRDRSHSSFLKTATSGLKFTRFVIFSCHRKFWLKFGPFQHYFPSFIFSCNRKFGLKFGLFSYLFVSSFRAIMNTGLIVAYFYMKITFSLASFRDTVNFGLNLAYFNITFPPLFFPTNVILDAIDINFKKSNHEQNLVGKRSRDHRGQFQKQNRARSHSSFLKPDLKLTSKSESLSEVDFEVGYGTLVT